jgi:putative ABC transport system permease protein
VALQREVVTVLPNVTSLDVEQIYRIVQTFLDRIAVVVQFMAAFCIAVGLVILLAAVATTKYQRIREAVLLKTLGATRGAVARVLTLEYLILGTLAGAVGVAAAAAFSWGLVTYVFDGHWDFSLPPYLAAWLATALVIALTGLTSSLDVLMKKPLEVLREE